MNDAKQFSGFPSEALEFYANLLLNNERAWFQAHKRDYETDVIKPAQAFVATLGEQLKLISPQIQYDTRANGSGSIMRIYRDVRFSQDKTPYKTYLGIIFWEGSGKKTDNPGFYFGMDATGGRVHVGTHGFPKPVLEAYREAVIDDQLGAELEAAITAVSQNSIPYEISGAHYKRVPRGYDKDQPRADLLRYNGLYCSSPPITPAEITSDSLVDICLTHFQNTVPIYQWLVKIMP